MKKLVGMAVVPLLLWTLLGHGSEVVATKNYGKLYIYDTATMQSLSAVTGLTLSEVRGGAAFAVGTTNLLYKISGLSPNGRLPFSSTTNISLVTTTVRKRSVQLDWTEYTDAPALTNLVILRAVSGGATTTWLWRAESPYIKSFIDTGDLTWKSTLFTGLYSQVSAPTFTGISTTDYADGLYLVNSNLTVAKYVLSTNFTTSVSNLVEVRHNTSTNFTTSVSNLVVSKYNDSTNFTTSISNLMVIADVSGTNFTTSISNLVESKYVLATNNADSLYIVSSNLTVARYDSSTNYTLRMTQGEGMVTGGQVSVIFALPTSTNTWTAADTGRLWNSNGLAAVFAP